MFKLSKTVLPFGTTGLKKSSFDCLVSLGLTPQLDVHLGGQVQHLLAVLLDNSNVNEEGWELVQFMKVYQNGGRL